MPTVELEPDADARPRRKLGKWTWLAPLFLVVLWLVTAIATNEVVAGTFLSPGDFEFQMVTDSEGEWRRIPYQQGKQGELVWSLQNLSPFPISLLDVGVFPAEAREDRDSWHGLIVRRGEYYEANPTLEHNVDDPALFESTPLRLAPGEQRSIALLIELANCEWNTPLASIIHSLALVRFSYLGLSGSIQLEFPKVGTTATEACEAPINLSYDTGEAAVAAGQSLLIPAAATAVQVATGEAGTVIGFDYASGSPAECAMAAEFSLWSYRPEWVPQSQDEYHEPVFDCDGNWFWSSPQPDQVLIWESR